MVMSDEIASTQTAFTAMIAVVVCTLVVVDVVSARFSDVRPSDVDEWMRDYRRRESRLKSQVQAYNIVGLLHPFRKYRNAIVTIAAVCTCAAVALTVIYMCYSYVSKSGHRNCSTCKCHRYRSQCCDRHKSRIFTEF